MGDGYTLYSDGGGNTHSSAAAAAIVREAESGRERRLIVFLGGATNNEAEITGALVGFSFLRALQQKKGGGALTVHWVADSEYTLKSATQYIKVWQLNGWKTAAKQAVKNQGLWRAYLALARGLTISIEHVAGHSGHVENEACDRASTWARERGADFIAERGDGALLRASDGGAWAVLDGRPFLDALRPDNAGTEGALILCETIAALGLDDFPESNESTPRASVSPEVLPKLIRKIALLRREALAAGKDSEQAAALAEDLGAILERYKS